MKRPTGWSRPPWWTGSGAKGRAGAYPGIAAGDAAAALDWYRLRGVVTVDLRASDDGEPLYQALGFVRTFSPTMRLSLAPAGRVDRPA
jgi:hypothetical protein